MKQTSRKFTWLIVFTLVTSFIMYVKIYPDPAKYPDSFCKLTNFSIEVTSFIKEINSKNLPIFIIDTHILCSLLGYEDSHKLRIADMMPEINVDPSLVTFGAKYSYVKHLGDLCKYFVFQNGSCERMDIPDRIRDDHRGSYSWHYLITINSQRIHLVVFEEKHSLQIIKPVPKYYNQVFDQRFGFGDVKQIFEDFALEEMELNNQAFIAPIKIISFMRQIRDSQLIECNETVVDQHENDLGLDILLQSVRESEARDVLRLFKGLLDDLVIPFWLTSDTLQGWYRYCRLVSPSNTLSLGTWAKFAKINLTEKLYEKYQGDQELITWTYGDLHQGLRSVSQLGNVTIDLVYFYEERFAQRGGPYLFSEHVQLARRVYFRNIYPSFKLCSTIFLNTKVAIPCQVEEFLRDEGILLVIR